MAITLRDIENKFGYLDYAYSYNRLNFYRDNASHLSKKEVNHIANKVEFVLYPYVHSEIYWSLHEQTLLKLANGFVHPHSCYLIEIFNLEQECDIFSENIPDSEFDYCLDIVEGDCEYDQNQAIGKSSHMYIKNKKRTNEIWLYLQSIERNKVSNCVNEFIDGLRE